MQIGDVQKHIGTIVTDPSWNKIFRQNVNTSKGYPSWDFNLDAIVKNMQKNEPDLATWSQSYGLWPGRAWVMLAAYSKWYHLSTNTLPFYNVFPRLEGQFGRSEFNIFGNNEKADNHWVHQTKDKSEQFHLSNRMWRWLRYKDGAHVLLGDKTEAGWYYLQDRGFDPATGTGQGEYTPEHVHHNYKHNDVYERSRKRRGVEGAGANQFVPKGKFSDEKFW